MNFIEIFLISLGLSTDAFAVATCIGLTMKRFIIKKAVIVGLYFGFFQAGMPLIGYFAAMQFVEHIMQYNHWVVFFILSFIGVRMIWGSFKKRNCPDRVCSDTPCTDRKCPAGKQEISLKPAKMIPLAIATSIDALAVGMSLVLLEVRIVPAISIIGIITFVLSMIGMKIGNVFGSRFKSKAELAGGVILVLIGLRILLEGLTL
ncbi:MAG: manganese efflux pump MntP family protein [Defluviitaleaceae bacterium]|nr:manganese efflux pump MntP family protein [Defluviitaleaceae bacterium]